VCHAPHPVAGAGRRIDKAGIFACTPSYYTRGAVRDDPNYAREPVGVFANMTESSIMNMDSPVTDSVYGKTQ
jgi:hypothetical protein